MRLRARTLYGEIRGYIIAYRRVLGKEARAAGEGTQRGAIQTGYMADLVALQVPGGLRRGESGESAFLRVLREFEGRYEDAVAGVWVAGERVKSV